MKEQKKIPTSKVNRASRFMKTGMKVGGNYLRHYSQKLVNPELNRDDLNQRNAEEIYGTLSELKGSALKVAHWLEDLTRILDNSVGSGAESDGRLRHTHHRSTVDQLASHSGNQHQLRRGFQHHLGTGIKPNGGDP